MFCLDSLWRLMQETYSVGMETDCWVSKAGCPNCNFLSSNFSVFSIFIVSEVYEACVRKSGLISSYGRWITGQFPYAENFCCYGDQGLWSWVMDKNVLKIISRSYDSKTFPWIISGWPAKSNIRQSFCNARNFTRWIFWLSSSKATLTVPVMLFHLWSSN